MTTLIACILLIGYGFACYMTGVYSERNRP